MAKDKAKNTGEAEEPENETDGGAEGGDAKKGFVKKLLANKKLLMIAAGVFVLVLCGGGAGAWYFLFRGDHAAKAPANVADAGDALPLVPPKVAFYDMPDMVVNIQSPDGTPAYLKLSVSLELKSAEETPGIKALMPRVVDQFQTYLRELRVDDLRGSESVLRLKEELLRRINVTAAPYRVRDVLLKEMIVQ